MNSRLAARRITRFLERAMAGIGLTLAQLGLMTQIAVAPADTMGALAHRTGFDQSTLSRNLRTLEADGLIEIAVVEADLRRRVVWLTDTEARRLERAIREGLPAMEGWAGRAERAHRNMLENLVLFASLVLVAHITGKANAMTALGAQLFFWARLVYVPIYLIGMPFVRTATWAISIVGLVLIFVQLL